MGSEMLWIMEAVYMAIWAYLTGCLVARLWEAVKYETNKI